MIKKLFLQCCYYCCCNHFQDLVNRQSMVALQLDEVPETDLLGVYTSINSVKVYLIYSKDGNIIGTSNDNSVHIWKFIGI